MSQHALTVSFPDTQPPFIPEKGIIPLYDDFIQICARSTNKPPEFCAWYTNYKDFIKINSNPLHFVLNRAIL